MVIECHTHNPRQVIISDRIRLNNTGWMSHKEVTFGLIEIR